MKVHSDEWNGRPSDSPPRARPPFRTVIQRPCYDLSTTGRDARCEFSAAELKKCIDMALQQARQAMMASASCGSEDRVETWTLAAGAQLVLAV